MEIPAGLVYVSDDGKGITRKKWGRGYRYFDEDNVPIKASEEIDRIKKLVIPPAWKDVWISPTPNGHIQVTGIDDKRRKQYIYHPKWVKFRQTKKFEKLMDFGESLTLIRSKYESALKLSGWPKKKVVALIIMLLDKYYFRIGNHQYARENNTYGVTTLRRKHVNYEESNLSLSYVAKSGKPRSVKIDNKKVAKLIREMSELPGYEIFRYAENGNYIPVYSKDVNEYLKASTNREFTAKFFRTWGASKMALENYPKIQGLLVENDRLKFEPTLVKQIASCMGNTQAVCREYYIHPGVLSYLDKRHPDPLPKSKAPKTNLLSSSEVLLLKILRDEGNH